MVQKKTMKAVVYRSYGGPEVLEIADLPEPKMIQDSVLVQVRAASINPADIALRAGVMDHALEAFFPVIPGWDIAGVVEESGPGAAEFAPGDEVIGYVRENLLRAHGGYAEKIAADVRTLVRKPGNLSWAEAASLPLAGLTSYQAVVHALNVSAGETLVVHAAAGGVGSLAAQIGVARGARVIGTASEVNHEYLRSVGVEPVRYGQDVAARIRALAPDGVDAVLDVAGRGVLATTTAIGKTDVRAASVTHDTTHPGTIQVFGRHNVDDLRAVVTLAAEGRLNVRVAATFPLERVSEAEAMVASKQIPGKIVLSIS